MSLAAFGRLDALGPAWLAFLLAQVKSPRGAGLCRWGTRVSPALLGDSQEVSAPLGLGCFGRDHRLCERALLFLT